MRILTGILIFYKKLVVPTLILSTLLGIMGSSISSEFSLRGIGLAYILLSPLFHYFIYEIRNPNEYYFYYNLGLSKYMLWGATLLLSTLIGLIFLIV